MTTPEAHSVSAVSPAHGSSADSYGQTPPHSSWGWPGLVCLSLLLQSLCPAPATKSGKRATDEVMRGNNLKLNEAQSTCVSELYPLVDVMYFVFTCMPGESYCRWLGALLLCLCDVFQAPDNSLVCWFMRGKDYQHKIGKYKYWWSHAR